MDKRCSRCGKEKPATLEFFYKHATCKDGLFPYCKDCHAIGNKRWNEENPYRRREIWRKSHFFNYNGLTLEDYDNLLEDQNGECAICNSKIGRQSSPNLFVDHDHNTGKVRGLLCHACNTALGLFQDDPKRLESALAYLGAS